jgi:putative endonuclease
MKESYVYILANRKNGTLYIGVTSDITKRIQEHRLNIRKGFTQKHHTHILVYYEIYFDIRTAIEREKCLKKWNRLWKLHLIETLNPKWDDLWPGSPPSRG